MDDLISRQAAKHALCKAVHKKDELIPCENQTCSCLWTGTRVCDYARAIDDLPSVHPEPDWDEILIICDNCGHAVHAKREDCKVSVQPEENCDTCKHGYFGSEMCNNCRVGYPSHYERKDDGVDC